MEAPTEKYKHSFKSNQLESILYLPSNGTQVLSSALQLQCQDAWGQQFHCTLLIQETSHIMDKVK
jgi:hypothetical protein